ncbi:MAG: phosphate-starvation-inducible PsiE family protein [Gammaproteobacteria bacterium]
MKNKSPSELKLHIQRAYDITIDVIVYGLILLMLATLIFAFIDVLVDIIHLIPGLTKIKLDDVEFRDMVVSVLDVFVVIELFSIFINYVKTHRIRLSLLIDVTAVFILREMIIKIYGKIAATEQLLVLALLLIVIVSARSITGRLPPKSNPNP